MSKDGDLIPTMSQNLRRIQTPRPPGWAHKTLVEFDLNLARTRAWHNKLVAQMEAGEAVDYDQLARAEMDVRRAEGQWNNVVNIAFQRRQQEYDEVIVPMHVKDAAEWWRLELLRREAAREAQEKVEKLRVIEGKQNAVLGKMIGREQPYHGTVKSDFDTTTQYDPALGGFRVGEIAVCGRLGTELAHTSGAFAWPARPDTTPAPPPVFPCVRKADGTSFAAHSPILLEGANQLERSRWVCKECGQEWPPETWPLPQRAA